MSWTGENVDWLQLMADEDLNVDWGIVRKGTEILLPMRQAECNGFVIQS